MKAARALETSRGDGIPHTNFHQYMKDYHFSGLETAAVNYRASRPQPGRDDGGAHGGDAPRAGGLDLERLRNGARVDAALFDLPERMPACASHMGRLAG